VCQCIIGDLRVPLDRRGLGDHLLDIFKRQIELVGISKLCGASKHNSRSPKDTIYSKSALIVVTALCLRLICSPGYFNSDLNVSQQLSHSIAGVNKSAATEGFGEILRASKHDFITLDGLRGVAAVAIVIGHCPEFFPSITAYGYPPEVTPEAGLLFENYLAVDFFFVLSGFVLMHAYGQKLHDGMSPTHFMAVRLIRLYPLYLIALGFVLLPYTWAGLHGKLGLYGPDLFTFAVGALFALLMLPSPLSSILFPLNAPAWSLFFELIANGIFGLLGRKLTIQLLAFIVAVSGALLCAAVSMEWFGFGGDGPRAMSDGWYWSSFGAGALRVSYSFFAGALTYHLWDKSRLPIRIPGALRSPGWLVAILIAIFAAHPPDAFERAYDLLITIVVFPAIVLIGASSKPSGYAARMFLTLGLASYGVYVLQLPAKDVLLRALIRTHVSLTPAMGIGFIAFLFVFVLAADYVYDVPVRRWLSAHILHHPVRL
jgi:peptidoglycan/LPS O-acetylase OafA/YrhL